MHFNQKTKIKMLSINIKETSVYNVLLKCSKKKRLFMPLADVSFTEDDFTLMHL